MTREAFIQAKKTGQIPTLAEVADLNLCDLGIAVNYGITKVRKPETDAFYVERGKKWRLFTIEDPCKIGATLTKTDLQSLLPILQHHHHTVDFYPPHYFKGQSRPLYGLTLQCGFNDWRVDLKLVDFGLSYGKVVVNGIECGISHSGGSGHDEYAGEYPFIACQRAQSSGGARDV
jgi:hypothetical protein